LLLATIGQVLEEENDQVCGAVVNLRKGQDKLCVWTKDAENKDAVLRIGNKLKKVLELPDSFPCAYQAHFSKDPKAKTQNLYTC